jgi:hypothetical protein
MSGTSDLVLGFVGTLIDDCRRTDLNKFRTFFNEILEFTTTVIFIDQPQGSKSLWRDLIESRPVDRSNLCDKSVVKEMTHPLVDVVTAPVNILSDVGSQIPTFKQLLEDKTVGRELKSH